MCSCVWVFVCVCVCAWLSVGVCMCACVPVCVDVRVSGSVDAMFMRCCIFSRSHTQPHAFKFKFLSSNQSCDNYTFFLLLTGEKNSRVYDVAPKAVRNLPKLLFSANSFFSLENPVSLFDPFQQIGLFVYFAAMNVSGIH